MAPHGSGGVGAGRDGELCAGDNGTSDASPRCPVLAMVEEVTAALGTAGAPRAAATTPTQPQLPVRNQNSSSENRN